MGNLYASSRNSDYSDEPALLDAKRNNDSGTVVVSCKKKFLSAVEDENEDTVESLLDEIFNTSHIYVKSWSSDSDPEEEDYKFEIWREAMYITMEKDTKHSEEILKLLLDCDIIWSLETKMDDLLHRLIPYENKVEDKNLRLIEMLLKSGKIEVNAKDEDMRTALHFVQDNKFISLLIHYGADVNKKDKKGKTPFMPEWGKSVSVLQTILKESRTLVDLDAIDCNGRTALMIAASDVRPDVVELLLNAGASVNLSDHLGFTALHHALFTTLDHYDHFPRNSEELRKRNKIFTILYDVKDKRWDWYRRTNSWDANIIVEMLLRKQDIDVNALSFEKFSPLDLAEGWIPQLPSSIKNALKEKGAMLNVFQQTETQSKSDFFLDVRCRLTLQRLLQNASRPTIDVDLLEERLLTLIDTFQDQIVSCKDQQGRTALHMVANYFSIMWYDWKFGIDFSQIFERQLANTIVKKLIAIGCSVNETDIYGRTPLHYANFILKKFLISFGADASIKDKDGNSAVDEILQQSSTNSSDIVEAVVDRYDEIYFLRLMNNKQMEIAVQCLDSEVRAYDYREFWHKTAPRLLWEEGAYGLRHPLADQITEEVTDFMGAIAKEIERLDPRFAIRPEFVGSSNEETKLDKPDEFDFCFVLIKISALCEVSHSPELPTGFVRLKRKPTKAREISDFDSFFSKGGILNTEKLKWQFTTMLRKALVNIESQQSFDWILEMRTREKSDAINKVSSTMLIKSLNFASLNTISVNIVPCIDGDCWWPDEAISNVSAEIKNSGCNLIFESPHELYPWVPYSESCARISFAKAESDMIRQSCVNAKEAYMIGKTMIEESELDFIDSSKYTLKNCLLYCIEALTPTYEKAFQLGFSIEELNSKFHQMDRYLWLKCLMLCRLEFVSQDFCPCYFLPNFSTPTVQSIFGNTHLKKLSQDWIRNRGSEFPKLCKKAYAFYRCTSNAISDSCYQLPAPDPLWERFDRKQLIACLCEITYSNLKM